MGVNQELKIIHRSYGIADRYDNGTIEINKNLEKYPELKSAIIRHEIKHTNNPRFNKKDFLHDLEAPEQLKLFTLIKFIFKHPLSLVQFLPAYYTRKKGLVLDLNLIVIYSVVLSVLSTGIVLGFVL